MGKIFSQYAGVESFRDPPHVEVIEVDADRRKSLGIRDVNRRFFKLSVQLPALIFILVYRLRLLRGGDSVPRTIATSLNIICAPKHLACFCLLWNHIFSSRRSADAGVADKR